MYNYKLNDNVKDENRSINGIHLTKNWSQDYSDRLSELKEFLRTRSNLEGIVDFKYSTKVGNDTIVIFESERDCDTEIELLHKSEIAAMPRSEMMKLAFKYDIYRATYMPEPKLQEALLEAQFQFEKNLDPEKARTSFSKVRLHMIENQIG